MLTDRRNGIIEMIILLKALQNAHNLFFSQISDMQYTGNQAVYWVPRTNPFHITEILYFRAIALISPIQVSQSEVELVIIIYCCNQYLWSVSSQSEISDQFLMQNPSNFSLVSSRNASKLLCSILSSSLHFPRPILLFPVMRIETIPKRI